MPRLSKCYWQLARCVSQQLCSIVASSAAWPASPAAASAPRIGSVDCPGAGNGAGDGEGASGAGAGALSSSHSSSMRPS